MKTRKSDSVNKFRKFLCKQNFSQNAFSRTFEPSKRHHRVVRSDYTFEKFKFYVQLKKGFFESQGLLKNYFCFIVLSFPLHQIKKYFEFNAGL